MVFVDIFVVNSLGGFKEGVGFVYKKCWICFVLNEEIVKIFRDDGLIERIKMVIMRNVEYLKEIWLSWLRFIGVRCGV